MRWDCENVHSVGAYRACPANSQVSNMADTAGIFHRVVGDEAAVVENHDIPNSAGNGDPLKAQVGGERGEE